MFSPYVSERVGHYVYALLDVSEIFYVGKG